MQCLRASKIFKSGGSYTGVYFSWPRVLPDGSDPLINKGHVNIATHYKKDQ